MKKLLILFIIFTLFLSGCARFVPGDYVVPDDGGFIAVIDTLYTPYDIGNYMEENFTYKIHDFIVQTPYELYLSKKGDCDDFSAFGVFVANLHGYEAYQIEVFDNTFYQHYIAVYDEDIWLSITDNQYYYFGFSNFEEAVDFVCFIRNKIWTKYIVYDFWNDVIEQVTK